jgi:hypothetical protein
MGLTHPIDFHVELDNWSKIIKKNKKKGNMLGYTLETITPSPFSGQLLFVKGSYCRNLDPCLRL